MPYHKGHLKLGNQIEGGTAIAFRPTQAKSRSSAEKKIDLYFSLIRHPGLLKGVAIKDFNRRLVAIPAVLQKWINEIFLGESRAQIREMLILIPQWNLPRFNAPA